MKTEKKKEIQDEAINLIFDIDGTLLSDKTGKIRTVRWKHLQKQRKMGIYSLLIRGERSVRFRKSFINLNLMDTCVGADRIFFHEEVLLESHIEEACGQKYIEQMRECGLDGVLEGTEDLYFPKKSRGLKNWSRKTLFRTIGSGKEEAYRRRWISLRQNFCVCR